MKASELRDHVDEFIAKHGDGDVVISTLDGFVNLSEPSVVEDLDEQYAPCGHSFVLWPEGPALNPIEETDAMITEEINEIAREI